jgi:DNA-directed RNA polymerase subunit M/transcription elongation factor TFIIS
MATAARQPDCPGEPTRYVFTILVRCPMCRSDRYKVYGKLPKTEKTEPKTQYARCKACSHKFFVISEESEE